ncbi:MAG: hypothetical protein JWP87_2747 [Labilithrix sp.]|nr:hypothetical protein [Labilithrix sp.]
MRIAPLAVVAAIVVPMLGAAPARAELIGATDPPLAFEFALPMKVTTPPFFLVMPISLSRQKSFRSITQLPPPLPIDLTALGKPLCLGASCAPKHTALDSDGNPAGAAESARIISGLGIGAKALALFSSPVPKRSSSIAMGVSPMFAFGGGGLEMRCVWW